MRARVCESQKKFLSLRVILPPLRLCSGADRAKRIVIIFNNKPKTTFYNEKTY